MEQPNTPPQPVPPAPPAPPPVAPPIPPKPAPPKPAPAPATMPAPAPTKPHGGKMGTILAIFALLIGIGALSANFLSGTETRDVITEAQASIEKVEADFKIIKDRVDAVGEKYGDVVSRFEALEKELAETKASLSVVDEGDDAVDESAEGGEEVEDGGGADEKVEEGGGEESSE